MEIIRFQHDGEPAWGAICAGKLLGVTSARPDFTGNFAMPGGVEATEVAIAAERLAPVDPANRIICVGLNYASHLSEAARDLPKWPAVFLRTPASFVGHAQPISRSALTEALDYEAELGVVIGRSALRVSEADAMDHVYGYTCVAENSVRDFQRHSRQVTAGKNFDRSGAMGPSIVSADMIPDPNNLQVRGLLNDREVQCGRVAEMIFPIPQLIAYLSSFMQLEPGDVIATGTPHGVGARQNPPRFLQPGDSFTVDIEGVGQLTNAIIAPDEVP